MNNDLHFSIKYCIASEALEYNVQLMLDYFYGTFCYFSSFRATGQHSLPLFGVTWGWVDDLSTELPYF